MSEILTCISEIENDKSNLIKGLQYIQEREGYISDDSIRKTAEYFSMSEAEVEGVVSFYAQFKRNKPGKYQLSICDGTACHIKGSSLLAQWISSELGISPGETDSEGLFSMETVACLGCCSLAPVMSINGKVYGKLNRKTTLKILKEYRKNG
jgi:NADH:ubiquinone oxidoreductase subunit E